MKLFFGVIFSIIFLSSCGGGGSSAGGGVTPPITSQPEAQVARQVSCLDCNQEQINTLMSHGTISGSAGETIVVTLMLTQTEYTKLMDLLKGGTSTTTVVKPPVNQNPTNCYLEYEHGRYEYECDSDSSYALLTMTSTMTTGLHCYYEYEHGRREYECEDGRYVVNPPSNGLTPPARVGVTNTLYLNPTSCRRDDDSYECYYADGYECEYEHGRWKCEYESGRHVVNPPSNGLTPPARVGVTNTLYLNPTSCHWDDDEYECRYADGYECEYEHGRWECEYEHDEYHHRNYYSFFDREGGVFSGSDEIFEQSSLRGYLNKPIYQGFGVAVNIQNTHVEYQFSPVHYKESTLYSDFGFRHEKDGQTAMHYGKLTGVYPLSGFTPYSLDLYGSIAAGKVRSAHYEDSRLSGFSAGAFMKKVFSYNDEWHIKIHQPLAAEEIAYWRFAADAKIGDDSNKLAIGYRHNLQTGEDKAIARWQLDF